MDEHFQPETPPADPLMDALAELAQVKATNTDLADQFLRAKAEAENARRRAEEEISKARKFAVEAFAESLLPVADSLAAGLAIADASAEQLREGSEATCANSKARSSATKSSKSTPKPVPSSTRTSTRPSQSYRQNKSPIPWSLCCKRVI